MSTTTTNYGLIKPDTTDPILVGQLNDNADVIDATLKSLSDALDVAKLGIKYKGEVNYYSNLPSSGNQIGDAYTVKYAGSSGTTPDGTEYVWGTVSGTNQWINFSKDSYTKAEVDALLALKQNALSSTQLDAVNSGIDSAKVTQIETNKNNISTDEAALVDCVDNGKKNYSTITGFSKDTTTSGFASETNFGVTVPAGTYVISYDLTRSNNTKTGVIGFRDVDNTYTDTGYYWTTDSHQVQTVTFSKAVKAINMYVGAGTTCTLSNIMICKEAVYKASPTYQPYAMSNAELTQSLLPTSYSSPTLIDDTTCTINEGGYVTVGNIVVVNVTFTTTASYAAYSSIMQFPAPKNSGSITMVAAAHIDSSVNVAVNKYGQIALFDTPLPAGTYHFFTVYLKQ